MSNEKHEPYTGVDRLELLGFEIIDLVSCGYKETISEIENQIESESIVQYIREKYKDNLELLKQVVIVKKVEFTFIIKI